jgi:O-antigen ligase
VGCVLAGVYWVGFSNDPGLLGQPARAVLSQLAPSSRDQQSNQYRTIENVNLGITIRQSMPLGTGFGHPIPQTVPNVDISNIDSFISYLPHNGILYVWVRLGLPGIVAFWLMIGIAVASAAVTFRRPPNQVSLLISLALIAAVVGYVTQGFYDMGLYWFRIAIVMGCLMGALEAARRLHQSRVPAGLTAPPPQSATRALRKAKLGHAA